MDRPLRIAQVAPPLERVPPEGYGGTERVMYELIVELVRRGHDVTTFASGDSDVPGRHVPTVPVALRPADFKDDPMGYFLTTMLAVLDSAARLRPHPQPPRVVEPPPREGHERAGRRHVPRPARPAVVARAPRLADAGVARRDQQLPGLAPSGRRLDGRPQRPDARRTRRSTAAGRTRCASSGASRARRAIVEAIEIAADRRAAAADRGQDRPDRRRARVLRGGLRAGAQGRRVVGRVPWRGLGRGARRAARRTATRR